MLTTVSWILWLLIFSLSGVYLQVGFFFAEIIDHITICSELLLAGECTYFVIQAITCLSMELKVQNLFSLEHFIHLSAILWYPALYMRDHYRCHCHALTVTSSLSLNFRHFTRVYLRLSLAHSFCLGNEEIFIWRLKSSLRSENLFSIFSSVCSRLFSSEAYTWWIFYFLTTFSLKLFFLKFCLFSFPFQQSSLTLSSILSSPHM